MKEGVGSAARLLLNKAYEQVWHRGEQYANNKRVKIIGFDDSKVDAVVKGTKLYGVALKFAGGGISKSCSCPYAEGGSSRTPACKHMVAVAILWDELRGIKKPSKEEIESDTISRPLVSHSQITALYDDPLNADLEILRIAAEERGSWSRPHSRLPNMPIFSSDPGQPLNVKEIQKTFKEIERWANRRNYDFYFCAGEMVAAFCKVMRLVRKRIRATPLLTAGDILLQAQRFHYKLIMELIDDSDGLHVFTEAHLDDIYDELKKADVNDHDKMALAQRLKEFDGHRDQY